MLKLGYLHCKMTVLRGFYSVLRQNVYFVVAFIIGIGLSVFVLPLFSQQACQPMSYHNTNTGKIIPVLQTLDGYEPKINLAAKPRTALKAGHGVIRPRFHKAELGIKNKLFIAVLTSPESISSLAIALNKTTSKFVDKVMFFIDAPSAQRLNVSSLKLPGIVGFTDTRKTLKPFHLIKYVSDNFLEDFDFFFIIKDSSFINAQRLIEFTRKISISQDIHLGRIFKSKDTSKICSLDFGILFSNSVLRKMHKSLDWCVKNSVNKDDSVNVGQCVIHSSQVECSDAAQGLTFRTFQRKNVDSNLIPEDPTELKQLQQSIVISPLTKPEQYYQLHLHFTVERVAEINATVEGLRRSVVKLASSGVSERARWPPGSPPAAPALSHFDVLRWEHFSLTHKYLSNDFTNLVPLTGAHKQDIHDIVNRSISHIEKSYDGALKFYSFINGYQKFDASRGMDYIIDLAFRETTSGKIIHKRLEVFKSLGKIEMIPVPYVTENVRVHVIIPVSSMDIKRILVFLKQYSINAMEKKDLQFLMLVFIYNSNDMSKGDEDIFKEIKNKALTLSNKFDKVGNLIKWHSIKLPGNSSDFRTLSDSLLDFAVMDSVLKKFPLDSLILFGRANMEVRLDYFNRVRMNTVSGFQLFSPIPFTEYNPAIIYNENRPQPPELEINKNNGHYDSTNFKHLSFYTVDYLRARKKIEDVIPVVRSDKDIAKMLLTANLTKTMPRSMYTVNGIYNMFIEHSPAHMLRGVEPSLRLRHVDEACSYCKTESDFNNYCTKMQAFNLANRAQLGRLMLDYQSEPLR